MHYTTEDAEIITIVLVNCEFSIIFGLIHAPTLAVGQGLFGQLVRVLNICSFHNIYPWQP